MSNSWQASVVLITSSDRDESHFGTGFVIYKDEQTTYLLTCAHVVREVGGPGKIEIDGTQARVIAASPEEGADLAVLCVARLLDMRPLPLYVAGKKGKPFSTTGFQLDGKRFLIRELSATLGKRVGVQMRGQADRISAWDLEVTDTYLLQPGYSGSPVIDGYDHVIGVVNTRRGEGKRGVAISIEALKNVWPSSPPDLVKQSGVGMKQKGISAIGSASPDADRSLQESEQGQDKMVPRLLGLAIDLSGSMNENIRNNTGDHLTRLESVQQSLKRLTQNAQDTLQKEQRGERQSSIDVFAYGFGLRSLRVCDFLSLMEVGKDFISEDEIEQIKRDYILRMQIKYGDRRDLKDLVGHYLGSGWSDDVESPVERFLRSRAEVDIRDIIMRRVEERLNVKGRLKQQLDAVGDTTLPIEEVATLLSSGGEALINAEAFGDVTPMCEALAKITQRFERELAARSKDTVPVLFLLSDGKPNDCHDPRLMAEALKARGVTIVSCFVTDQDVADPRALLGKADPQWDQGAQLMFDMASAVQVDSQYAKYYLKKGWTIYPEAKLFVQLNHSEVLEEFIQGLDPTRTRKEPETASPQEKDEENLPARSMIIKVIAGVIAATALLVAISFFARQTPSISAVFIVPLLIIVFVFILGLMGILKSEQITSLFSKGLDVKGGEEKSIEGKKGNS